jgi:myo-inositol 2-dehydrogenase / D-chiro-inositol 1-dehydrogenase
MTSTIQKIKVCLVGAGAWGRQHARVFSERPDVELCAVAGRILEKTQGRASEFRLRAYTNVPEMLAAEKPDLVSLSLPNLEHFEATMQVIEAGYPLLVEKPLTFDLSEADQLLAEAEKRGDQPPVHARAGRRALQLAWAAVESFQSGKRVTLAH